MKCLAFILFICTHINMTAQKSAYSIFINGGNTSSYEELLDSCQSADIVMFGELHNNPICHWLQLELFMDLDTSRSLVIGLEMIERDNQTIFEAYLRDSMSHEELDTAARLWNNYVTDYKPLIDTAKAKGIPVIGTNVPRRYASQVYKQGVESLDSLSLEEKSWIAPLPFAYDKDLPGYKKMMDMFEDPAHANENLPKAQALKDATMAHFILGNWKTGQLMYHLNGSYHSDNYEGIVWYLKQQHENLKIVTISSKEQKSVDTLNEDHQSIADFIITIPERMTKTY